MRNEGSIFFNNDTILRTFEQNERYVFVIIFAGWLHFTVSNLFCDFYLSIYLYGFSIEYTSEHHKTADF